MKSKEELENCLASFERRCKIEQNAETKKMWNVLRIFCKFLLGRQGHMYYREYSIESDLEVDV